MFSKIIDTPAFVQSFGIDKDIFILTDNKILVFNIKDKKIKGENRIFEKDGLARALFIDNDHIYCKDFIDLYVIDRKKYQLSRN